jgi:hypothetical protein
VILARGVEPDVGVAALAVDPAEDRVVGSGAATHHVHDRQRNRHHQRLQDADSDDAGQGDGGDGDLDAAGPGEAAPGLAVDQPDGRGHDDGAQGRLGQMLHGFGEEQQHGGDGGGANQAESCVRPPIWSLTAVREPLAPTGKAWVIPAARLAAPIAASSVSARTCWP